MYIYTKKGCRGSEHSEPLLALTTFEQPQKPQNTAQSSSKPLLALQRQLPDHSAQLDAKQLVPRKNPPEICHVRSHFSGSFLTSQHRSSPLGAVELCSERLMETQTRVSSFRARIRLKSDMLGASFRVIFWPRGTARTHSEPFNFARNGSWKLRRA